MAKEIWVRADLPDERGDRKEMLIGAIESGITKALIRPDDVEFTSLGKIDLIIPGDDVRVVEISSPEGQDAAMALAGKCSTVVVTTTDWTVIPLENLIAAFSGSCTKLLACAGDVESAELYLETMEKGVDGVVVSVEDPAKVREFGHLAHASEDHLLEEVEVTAVRNIGSGDRVCIDTVSNMVPGEGMLIGSQSSCLFLVQSESEDSGYVASRPFRVNAGAVHAYVMGPEGKTRYLGEMRSGEPVAIVGRDGGSRRSSVGRCKIEVRPLVLVEAVADGRKHSTILQNAETVKLVSPSGAISVSELKPGDRVLARLETGGRHFGMRIEETLREI